MNPLLLGRNGRLLMPILALFLINVSVAEAKPNWAEGTKGNFTMVALIITTILVGLGIVGAIAYVYRTLVSRRSMPSDEEISNQIRESKEWLAYTEWIRADEGPTPHEVERAAAARVLDLERQLFGVPPPPSNPLLCRLFSDLFRAVKSSASGDRSASENNRRDKGKSPEDRHIPHLQSQIADEIGSSTTIKSHGHVVSYDSVYSVRSTGPSSQIAFHEMKASSTKDGGKNQIHKFVSSTESLASSRISTPQRIDFETIKDDGKKATNRSQSSNTSTDKNHKISKQYVITPPPDVHTAAASSKYVTIPAAASLHGFVAPSPSGKFAPYTYQQPRRARKPVPIIHHYT